MTSGVNNNCNNHNNNNSNNNKCNKIMNNNNNKMFSMNLHMNKMHSLDMNANATAVRNGTTTTGTTPPTLPSASPPDFDFNLPCRYFKSSFARSLSLNNASNHCKSLDCDVRSSSNNNNNNNNNNECNIINNHCPVLSQRPSRAVTPATATTIASINNNINSSNNILTQNEANYDNSNNKNNRPPAIPARRLTTMAYNLELLQNQQQQQQQQYPEQQQQQHVPLTQFRPTSAGNSHASAAHLNTIFNQQQQQHHAVGNHQQSNNNNNNNNNNKNINRRNIVWPRDSIAVDQDFELSDEAAEHEMTKILNDDYMLATEQQQQQHHYRPSYEPHEDIVNVEAVLLQNQVDTLQWQLKQVETSCVMYRAVMEEVARFLDRYHSQRQQQLLNRNKNNNNGIEQITRSKSLYHVYDGAAADDNNEDDCNAGLEKYSDRNCEQLQSACLRTRSSTNLIDLKQTPTTGVAKTTPKKSKLTKGSVDDQLYDIIAPGKNYNAFKDYTWRRSPKRMQECKDRCIAAEVEDKLNQEAFRLSRTIHNLLNTSMQQPDLTQHRNSLPVVGVGRLSKTPTNASILTLHQPLLNSTMTTAAGSDTCATSAGHKNNHATATAAEMLFLRSMNMRESRISLRSSTDSSVHSTSSSSKLETDEEHSPFSPAPHLHSAPKPIPQLGSTTEDESGFSSISSFQDIGVPLSSTMISTRHSLGNSAKAMHEMNEAMEANSLGGLDFHVDSRNSTLKAVVAPPPPPPPPTATTHPTNVVGVPLNTTPDMQHRWDSPAKTYSSAASKFQQRFSTLSNDDSNTVLWV